MHLTGKYLQSFANFVRSLILSFTRVRQPARRRPYVKIFKGWPLRDAPSKLVQLWCKIFRRDQSGLVEMKNPTRFSNETSTL